MGRFVFLPFTSSRIAAAAILSLLSMGRTLAQEPPVTGEPETVISEAEREKFDLTVHEFVQSLATPSQFAGKVAQWSAKNPLCPKALGLKPPFDGIVTRRIRAVAAEVGAPLPKKEPCRANMAVVFTSRPQALLDDVRKNVPRLLGYVTMGQRKSAATVRHPVQAWYATATDGVDGPKGMDDANRDTPLWTSIIGSHTRDGLRSLFGSVLVVVDTNTTGYKLDEITDYVVLLALTQTQSFDVCRSLPSISNLMAKGCDASTMASGLTESDIAYLKALYRLNPDKVLGRQVSSLASDMEDSLGGR